MLVRDRNNSRVVNCLSGWGLDQVLSSTDIRKKMSIEVIWGWEKQRRLGILGTTTHEPRIKDIKHMSTHLLFWFQSSTTTPGWSDTVVAVRSHGIFRSILPHTVPPKLHRTSILASWSRSSWVSSWRALCDGRCSRVQRPPSRMSSPHHTPEIAAQQLDVCSMT